MKVFKAYFQKQDSRGRIVGICQSDWLREINYIESVAGSVRGGHYHKKTKELFFIIDGKIEVEIQHLKTKRKKQWTMKPMDIFVVEPYEVHTFHILENSKWINALSTPMNTQDPDFYYVETEP